MYISENEIFALLIKENAPVFNEPEDITYEDLVPVEMIWEGEPPPRHTY